MRESASIAQKLKIIVESKNLSIREIANKINVSEGALRNYLNNYRVPDTITLLKLLHVLDINIYDLYDIESKGKNSLFSKEELEIIIQVRKLPLEQQKVAIELVKALQKCIKKEKE